MKTVFWIYAVVGILYFLMYEMGNSVVVRYAHGPLWGMMIVAPVILGLLLFLPIAQRLRVLDK